MCEKFQNHSYEKFLSDRIAELRTQKGVSARDMSLTLGQANNYINTIENNKALPSMQSFFNICEFFNISPQEFFDEGSRCPEKLRALTEEARRLDEHTLECFLEIIKKVNEKKDEKKSRQR